MRFELMTVSMAALLLAGCTSEGFSQREVRGHDVTSYVYATETAPGPDILSGVGGEADSADPPQITRPASLAVVQVGEVAPSDRALTQLAKHGDLFRQVSGVSGIAPGALGEHRGSDREAAVRSHVQHLRRLARDIGADYLLIYGGTVDTVNRGTALSMLDVTVVAMFVVPSRLLEAEGRGSAVLVDVATGRVVAAASADGRDRSMTPSFAWEGNQKQQLRHLRDEIVEDLMKQTAERFRQMAIADRN